MQDPENVIADLREQIDYLRKTWRLRLVLACSTFGVTLALVIHSTKMVIDWIA